MLLVERQIDHSHHSLGLIYRLWHNGLTLRNIAETWVEAISQGVNAVIFFKPVYNPNSSAVAEEGGSKSTGGDMWVCVGGCVCVHARLWVCVCTHALLFWTAVCAPGINLVQPEQDSVCWVLLSESQNSCLAQLPLLYFFWRLHSETYLFTESMGR